VTQSFEGRRALVTGAGKGIGRDIVAALRRQGAEVLALSRTEADLLSLREETGCDIVAVDIEDLEAAAQAAQRALPFDMLVNNAGITSLQPAVSAEMDIVRRVYTVNVMAALRLGQVVAGDLIARGQPGAIVNVSSIASTVAFADHAAYCASKGALDALTRVLALEWGPHRIRVNAVNPTVTLTPMGELAWSDPAKSAGMLRRIPLGRFCAPADVTDVVVYLLGDQSAMLNGATLPIDGGFTAS
jgi:NAD(P)-dependent dehydrogenase (short-subunit alcohol dehydrogenase family)